MCWAESSSKPRSAWLSWICPDELSLGGKIPPNSNSVFTSRQSPFSAPAIARSAFCNSRCWVAEGREEEDTLEAGAGVAGAGAFGCGSGSVATTQVITNDDLATVVIKRVIFHDVPQKSKSGAAKPVLSDVQTDV